MKLLVGLGNPGKEYENSRHNVGFKVVETLVKRNSRGRFLTWSITSKPPLSWCKVSPEIIVVKPLTFMNLSGEAVSYLLKEYRIDCGSLWVVHDDLDIPVGSFKIKEGGGSAGHHGIESI